MEFKKYIESLRYPSDCSSKTVINAITRGGKCDIESGAKHWKVKKDSNFVTTIPFGNTKDNGTCRSYIKQVNNNCL